jgi:tetratricopeptide (TPR) repeat protein
VTNKNVVSVRAYTGAYLSAAAVCCFVAAFLSYLDHGTLSLAAVFAALILFPVLASRDRIRFDGKRLSRTGVIWRLFRYLTKQPDRLRLRSVVHVETESFRAVRRGPNVKYVYRTSLHGADLSFQIASGRGYRQFIESVLPLIAEGCLDLRSVELRDHFVDASVAIQRALTLNIPRSDVLESSAESKRERQPATVSEPDADAIERSGELRQVANELRANGRLLQSIEAFRRAVRLTPRDARLIYEFARCVLSLGAARRDDRLTRKAHAMLRLAELRSAGDSDLMSRLGETYFSLGEWRRAEKIFKRAAESGKAGYRIFRGLGELALRDGKIAHAINYFAKSAETAKPPTLFRWASAETEYLRHINEDDEYMEVEIGRVNLYDTFDGVRRTAVRIFCVGLPFILIGVTLSISVVANIGWAISGVALATAVFSALFKQLFASRIPFDLVDKER